MPRESGNVMNIVTSMICVLTMTIMVISYFGCAGLLERKAAISQIARKYILRMETVGYLTENDCQTMAAELSKIGAVELDFTGSTLSEVTYGAEIVLMIRGKLEGDRMIPGKKLLETEFGAMLYEFTETKKSTAKN